MKQLTASRVGSILGRAGFQSQRGCSWAHGFKASAFTAGTVIVYASFRRDAQRVEALAAYEKTLIAAGLQVENTGDSLFVTC